MKADPTPSRWRSLYATRIRLGDVSSSRNNNFDVLRLAAALLVMVDHAHPLTGQPHFLAARLGFSLGELAVSSFFVMSGFLVAKSWLDDPSVIRFVGKRALRLLPGLLVAVAFAGLIVGPLATDLSVRAYLGDPATHTFLIENAKVFPIRYYLPGVFTENPYPGAVNGSLWSLPVEVLAYGVVLVLGITSLLRRPVALAAVFAFTLYMDWHLVERGWLGAGVWFHMPTVQIWHLVALFLLGSLFYIHRDRIVLSVPVMLGLLGVLFVAMGTAYVPVLFWLAIPYGLFTLGYLPIPWVRRLTAPGDLSYGVYIYAFPVQQSVMNAWPTMGPWAQLALAVPATYALAFLSWRLVERPALRLKRHLDFRPRPAPVPSPVVPG